MTSYRRDLLREINIKNSEEELTGFDWLTISLKDKLSEEFIREFQDNVIWQYICEHQTLSKDFLNEFKDRIIWSCYFVSKEVEYEIMKSFILKTDYTSLDSFETLHLSNNQRKEIQRILDLKHTFHK